MKIVTAKVTSTMAMFLPTLILMSLVGASHALAATDEKIYSGGSCHIGHYNDFPNAVWHIYSGEFTNYGETSIRVTCPIIKDTMAQPIKSGWVRMIDQHSFYDVRCTIISNPSHTSTSGYTRTVATSGKSAAVQTKSFSSLGHAAYSSYYSMECFIPRNENYPNFSSIKAYHIEEND